MPSMNEEPNNGTERVVTKLSAAELAKSLLTASASSSESSLSRLLDDAKERVNDELVPPAVFRVSQQEELGFVRLEAADALKHLNDELAKTASIILTYDEDEEVCISALQGLSEWNTKLAIARASAIIQECNTSQPKLSLHAINLLVTAAPEIAKGAATIAVQKETNPIVKKALERAVSLDVDSDVVDVSAFDFGKFDTIREALFGKLGNQEEALIEVLSNGKDIACAIATSVALGDNPACSAIAKGYLAENFQEILPIIDEIQLVHAHLATSGEGIENDDLGIRHTLLSGLSNKELLNNVRDNIQEYLQAMITSNATLLASTSSDLKLESDYLSVRRKELVDQLDLTKSESEWIAKGEVPLNLVLGRLYGINFSSVLRSFFVFFYSQSLITGLIEGKSVWIPAIVLPFWAYSAYSSFRSGVKEDPEKTAVKEAGEIINTLKDDRLSKAESRKLKSEAIKSLGSVSESIIAELEEVDKKIEVNFERSSAILEARKAIGKTQDDDAFAEGLESIRRRIFSERTQEDAILKGVVSNFDLPAESYRKVALKIGSRFIEISNEKPIDTSDLDSTERSMLRAILDNVRLGATTSERTQRLIHAVDLIDSVLESKANVDQPNYFTDETEQHGLA